MQKVVVAHETALSEPFVVVTAVAFDQVDPDRWNAYRVPMATQLPRVLHETPTRPESSRRVNCQRLPVKTAA
jgi:hypothetical protein